MERDEGRHTEADRHPDRRDEREAERPPATEEQERGADGVAKQAYEEAIAEAVKDVHG